MVTEPKEIGMTEETRQETFERFFQVDIEDLFEDKEKAENGVTIMWLKLRNSGKKKDCLPFYASGTAFPF